MSCTATVWLSNLSTFDDFLLMMSSKSTRAWLMDIPCSVALGNMVVRRRFRNSS